MRQTLGVLGRSEWAEAPYLQAPEQTGGAHFAAVQLTHRAEEGVSEGVVSEGPPLFRHP